MIGRGRESVSVVAAFRGGRRRSGGPKQMKQSSAGGVGSGRRSARSGPKTNQKKKEVQSGRRKEKGFVRGDSGGDEVVVDEVSVDEVLMSDDEGLYSDLYDSEVEDIVENVLNDFAFPLDPFQEKAFRHLLCGRSVVVCAPTGAGKTAIAEAAATYFLRQGGKVIYTTPLKALSNQKMMEMRERFGVDEAGLQTGDASINPDGSVVVMTTEILRNILYRVIEEEELAESSKDELSLEQSIALKSGQPQNRLDGVKLVVFDECHYLGDPGRGSVWEESIINLPPDVLILAMSATVKNPMDISGWISEVHGTCATVMTTFRPVPLKWHFCLTPGNNEVKMLPLLDDTESGLNPRLIPPSSRVESFAGSLSSWESDDDVSWGGASTWGRLDDVEEDGFASSEKKKFEANLALRNVKSRTLDELIDVLENADPWHKLRRRDRVPSIEGTIAKLQEQSLLPAIWFIFSRKDCEAAVGKIYKSGMKLTTAEEQDVIKAMVNGLRESQPEAVKEESVASLIAGAAAHHAGCLPGWKLLIERLFQEGLLKVVFATETLAAGINMPARTTLLTSLSKRRDEGISLLRHNELMQMAGRAGRRGYDTQGHCVIVQSRWDNPDAAWTILKKGPESLESKFATNYGMALNLLRTKTLGEAKEFLNRSFSMYLSGSYANRKLKEINRLEKQAQQVLENAGVGSGYSSDESSDQSVIQNFEKLQGRRREEKRAARLLRQQLADERGYIAESILSEVRLTIYTR
jgi:superfamily II RNA helicase